MSNFINLMDIVYPVGSIYQSMSATSPASTIGGTWTQLKTFLYGSTTAKQTGGETTHTLTVNEIPSHTHDMYYSQSGTNLALPSNVGNWYVFTSQFGWICPNNPIKENGGGASTQQPPALHDLFHLVSHSITALKASGLNLSEVAYV